MTTRFACFNVLFSLILLLGCGGGGGGNTPTSTPPPPPNPTYPALTLQATTWNLGPKGTTRVWIKEQLIYTIKWTCSAGSFSTNTGLSVDYTAPANRGDVTITAQIDGDSKSYSSTLHVIPIQVLFDQESIPRDAPYYYSLSVHLVPDQGDVDWSADAGTLTGAGNRHTYYSPPILPGTFTITAQSKDDPLASATFKVINNPQQLVIRPTEQFITPWGQAGFTVKTLGIVGDDYQWTAEKGSLVDQHSGGTMRWTPPDGQTGDFLIGVRSRMNPNLQAEFVVHVTGSPIPQVYFDSPYGLRARPGETIQLAARTLNATDARVLFSSSPNSQDPIPEGSLLSNGVFNVPSTLAIRKYKVTGVSAQFPYINNEFEVLVHPSTLTPDHIDAGIPVQLAYARLDSPATTWSWLLPYSSNGRISPTGYYSPPAFSAWEWLQVYTNDAHPPVSSSDYFSLPVFGKGPFQVRSQQVPKGWWDSWFIVPSGDLVILGGLAEKKVLSLNLADNTVRDLGQLKYHHYYGKAFYVGSNKALVIGGDESEGLYHRPVRMEIFDIAQGTTIWESSLDRGQMLFDRIQLPDGRCVISGVDLGAYNMDPKAGAGLWMFDPTTRQMSPIAKFPNQTHRPTLTLLRNGKVLVSGGYWIDINQSKVGYREIYEWDPATGAFRLLGMMNLGTWYHTATELPDGRILILGGSSYYNTYGEDGAEIFNPATGISTGAGRMVVPRFQHSAAWISSSELLVAGGYAGQVEIWDILTGKSRSAGSLHLPCFNPALFVQNGNVFSGSSDGSVEASSVGLLLTTSLSPGRDTGSQSVADGSPDEPEVRVPRKPDSQRPFLSGKVPNPTGDGRPLPEE